MARAYRAAASAVLSGRSLLVIGVATLLAYVFALVAKGGDTIALTSQVELFRAALDPMGIVASSWWATLAATLYGVLAAVAAAQSARLWLDTRPRFDPFGARSWLARAGPSPSGRPEMIRRGATGLGKALALGALALLAGALIVSAHLRGAGRVQLPEGAVVQGGQVSESRYRWLRKTVRPIDAAVFGPDDYLTLSSIDLQLDPDLIATGGNRWLKTGAVAHVRLVTPASDLEFPVRPWPGTRVHGQYLHLTQSGLAPRIVVTDRARTRIVDARFIAESLLLSRDETLSLDPAPLRLSLRAVKARGVVHTSPRDIVYRARLFDRTGRILAQGELARDVALKGGGYTVALPDTGAWVRIDLVRDPGIIGAYSAPIILLVAILVGLVARFYPRLELWPDPDEPDAWVLARPRFTVLVRGRPR